MTALARSSESLRLCAAEPSELAWPSMAIFLMCGAFLIVEAISSSRPNDAGRIVALLYSNWIFSVISILLSLTITFGGGSGGFGASTGGGGGGGASPAIVTGFCPENTVVPPHAATSKAPEVKRVKVKGFLPTPRICIGATPSSGFG